jgi:hypothetical protein
MSGEPHGDPEFGARGWNPRTLSKGKLEDRIRRSRTENHWGNSGIGAGIQTKASPQGQAGRWSQAKRNEEPDRETQNLPQDDEKRRPLRRDSEVDTRWRRMMNPKGELEDVAA